MVQNQRVGGKAQAQAATGGAQTPLHLLAIEEIVLGHGAADIAEAAADQHRGPVEIGLTSLDRRRIGPGLEHRSVADGDRPPQPGLPHAPMGLHPPVRQIECPPDRITVPGLQPRHMAGQGVRVRLRIGIEDPPGIGVRRLRHAPVHAAGKSGIVVGGHKGHPLPAGQPVRNRGHQGLERRRPAVFHDHHGEVPMGRARQGGEAADNVFRIAIADDDDTDLHQDGFPGRSRRRKPSTIRQRRILTRVIDARAR